VEKLLDLLSNPELLDAVRMLLLAIVGGVTLVAGAALRRWARLLDARAAEHKRATDAATVLTAVKAAEQRGAYVDPVGRGQYKYNLVVEALTNQGLDGCVGSDDIEAAVLDVNKEYGTGVKVDAN